LAPLEIRWRLPAFFLLRAVALAQFGQKITGKQRLPERPGTVKRCRNVPSVGTPELNSWLPGDLLFRPMQPAIGPQRTGLS
tara:strand:+ start:9615 stop:9857 length:243 start_codon:yes stop_codon:yes gene_type:complete